VALQFQQQLREHHGGRKRQGVGELRANVGKHCAGWHEATNDGTQGCAVGGLAAGHDDVIADAKHVFEEERGAAAAQLAMVHDGDAIAKLVSFVHEVGGQNNYATCLFLLQ
jgi:hypothetical protein